MCEIANKVEQKAKAIQLLRKLDIYEPYIEGFEKENKVCFYERFGGYWVDQEKEIFEKMKQVEKEYDCTVYAITHEMTELGEMWSFLFVSKYKEDWEYSFSKVGKDYYVIAYVWNRDCEMFSEIGDIVIKSFGGGLCRVG